MSPPPLVDMLGEPGDGPLGELAAGLGEFAGAGVGNGGIGVGGTTGKGVGASVLSTLLEGDGMGVGEFGLTGEFVGALVVVIVVVVVDVVVVAGTVLVVVVVVAGQGRSAAAVSAQSPINKNFIFVKTTVLECHTEPPAPLTA